MSKMHELEGSVVGIALAAGALVGYLASRK